MMPLSSPGWNGFARTVVGAGALADGVAAADEALADADAAADKAEDAAGATTEDAAGGAEARTDGAGSVVTVFTGVSGLPFIAKKATEPIAARAITGSK